MLSKNDESDTLWGCGIVVGIARPTHRDLFLSLSLLSQLMELGSSQLNVSISVSALLGKDGQERVVLEEV